MPRILTDEEIERLLAEPKELPQKWRERLLPRKKAGYLHLQSRLSVTGSDGNRFRIDVRDNPVSLFDFSIILSFIDVDGTEYRLLRCNGKHSSEHTNKWEKKKKCLGAKFRNAFHVHKATERYQRAGFSIDGFAEVTDKYYSLDSALKTFISLGGGVSKDKEDNDPQKMLFE